MQAVGGDYEVGVVPYAVLGEHDAAIGIGGDGGGGELEVDTRCQAQELVVHIDTVHCVEGSAGARRRGGGMEAGQRRAIQDLEACHGVGARPREIEAEPREHALAVGRDEKGGARLGGEARLLQDLSSRGYIPARLGGLVAVVFASPTLTE